MRTIEDAVALVTEARVVTLTAVPGVPSIVEAVVGGSVRGSWWGHPLGGVIFTVVTALDEHPDVLTVKLVAGRVTFVHRDLWAALLRVVTDRGWRRTREERLDSATRTLLRRVEDEGAVELAGVDLPATARREIKIRVERSLLVLTEQRHTERGRHETTLRSWTSWAGPRLLRSARRLALDDAFARVEKESPAARRAL